MGRFSNLEFEGHEFGRQEPQPRNEELRDEAFQLRLGDQHYRSARFEQALRYYSRALEYNANLHAAWVGQVQMLVELGEYAEARKWADKALEVHRDHAEILSVKAVASARLGDNARAVQFSDAALAQRGTSPLVWLARGEALMADGQSNDQHCFERAATEARYDWFLLLRIARSCYWHRHFARAASWISSALKRESRSPFVFQVFGDCQLALGMAGKAERSYRQALSLDAGFEPASEALDALEKRGIVSRTWAMLAGIFHRMGG